MKRHPSPIQVFEENRSGSRRYFGPRHAFLTCWLLVMLVANVAGLMMLPNAIMVYQNAGVPDAATFLGLQGLCMGCNILFALAIFRWWKWGFYGIVVSTVVALGVNLVLGVRAEYMLFGFMGPFVLFWALHLDGMDSAWKRMR